MANSWAEYFTEIGSSAGTFAALTFLKDALNSKVPGLGSVVDLAQVLNCLRNGEGIQAIANTFSGVGELKKHFKKR